MSTTSVTGSIASKPTSKSEKTVKMTVLYAGNKASDSPITTSLDITSNYNARRDSVKTMVAETNATIAAGTDSRGVYETYAAGTFNYYNNSKFILFGYSGTNTLSGVSNAKLAFPSSDVLRNSIHKRETYRTLHASSWNWVTGVAATKTLTLDWAGVVATDSTDHAARPTRAVPGELTYLETGKTPTNADYPAKTL